MRYRDLLLEYNREKTLKNYREALKVRAMEEIGSRGDPLFPEWEWINGRFEDSTLAFFEKVDPTSKKAYVPAMVRWYLDGSMRLLEDAFKLKPVIPLVQKFKNRIPNLDLKSMSFDQFLDLGDELLGVKSKTELAKEVEEQFFKDDKATLFYNGSDAKIIIPHTKEAAQFFGRGTRWCTASTENNMFGDYNRDGPLFIILFKGKDQRWQFHFESGQFMDEQDHELPEDTEEFRSMMRHFQDHILERVQGPAEQPQLVVYLDNPPEEVVLKAIEDYRLSIPLNKLKNPSERVMKAAVLKDAYSMVDMDPQPDWLQVYAIEVSDNEGADIKWLSYPCAEAQLLSVQKNPENLYLITSMNRHGDGRTDVKIPDEVIIAAVSKNGKMIEQIPNPSPRVQMVAVQQDDRALQYIKNPTEEVCLYAVTKNANNIVYLKGKAETQTPAVQMAAIKDNPQLISYIRNPTPEVKKIAERGRNASLRASRDVFKSFE